MTPAIKHLEKHNTKHLLCPYTHKPTAESYGLEAADALNLSPKQVFKTLVVQDNELSLAVAVVPVSGTLNLKRMAAAIGAKKTIMAGQKRVENSTGYILGGISPLGQKRRLRTVIDESAFHFDKIYISAGKRGLNVQLSPIDLQALCAAQRSEIANTEL